MKKRAVLFLVIGISASIAILELGSRYFVRSLDFDWVCFEGFCPRCNLYIQAENCFADKMGNPKFKTHVFSGKGTFLFGQPVSWRLFIDNASPGNDHTFPLESCDFSIFRQTCESKLYGRVNTKIAADNDGKIMKVTFLGQNGRLDIHTPNYKQHPPDSKEKECLRD